MQDTDQVEIISINDIGAQFAALAGDGYVAG